MIISESEQGRSRHGLLEAAKSLYFIEKKFQNFQVQTGPSSLKFLDGLTIAC